MVPARTPSRRCKAMCLVWISRTRWIPARSSAWFAVRAHGPRLGFGLHRPPRRPTKAAASEEWRVATMERQNGDDQHRPMFERCMMHLTMCAVKSENLTRADLAVGLGIGVIALLLVGLIILK